MYVYILYSRRSAAKSACTAVKQLPNNKGKHCHPRGLETRKSSPRGFRDKTRGKMRCLLKPKIEDEK